MSYRVCGWKDCGRLQKGPFCDEHALEKRREQEYGRPGRRDRGYGTEHDRLRRYWKPIVAKGKTHCSVCGKLIEPNQRWDLGHVEGDRRAYAGPQHESCNRARGRDGSRQHR